MTKQQIRSELDRSLGEYLDGYALVGVVAGRSEVVVMARTKSTPETQAIVGAMEALMQDIKHHNTKRN